MENHHFQWYLMVFEWDFRVIQWDFRVIQKATGWGPQDSVQLVYKWLNSMVYGRYM
jgi:hypothetical protein